MYQMKIMSQPYNAPASYRSCADNSKKKQIRLQRHIIGLSGQLGEKYFDYFVFNIVDYGVNCGLLRSGARRRALA
jgi:hypothetical protein